jgi:hypothetical protein
MFDKAFSKVLKEDIMNLKTGFNSSGDRIGAKHGLRSNTNHQATNPSNGVATSQQGPQNTLEAKIEKVKSGAVRMIPVWPAEVQQIRLKYNSNSDGDIQLGTSGCRLVMNQQNKTFYLTK